MDNDTRMDDDSKRIKVPHMGFLSNFPVRYLRTRTMMGQGYGATQTRIIRENNETMQYVCLTLCAPFLSISNTHPAFRSIVNNGFLQQLGHISIIELSLTGIGDCGTGGWLTASTGPFA